MTAEEVKELMDTLKKNGMSDEDILNSILSMYIKKKIDMDDMESLVKTLGYEINEEIREALKNNPESLGLTDK